MIQEEIVLITGVNGFIGQHIAAYCMERGYRVIGVDISSTSVVSISEYQQLNLSTDEIDKILEKNKPYAVIHCAGLADVNYSVKYPDADFAMNVMISRKVLYSVKNCSKESRFIFLSSAAVYGDPSSLPIKESHERNPISPYALHKVLAEELCQYFVVQYGMDIRILRIFSAYGCGLKKQIFWDMGQKVVQTERLELFGTGRETRDYIYIDDLVNAIYLIMEAPKDENNIYNVANGVELGIKEIAEKFCDAVGLKREKIYFSNAQRSGNPVNWCADIKRLKKLGYAQKVGIDQGIYKYVEWLKSEKII